MQCRGEREEEGRGDDERGGGGQERDSEETVQGTKKSACADGEMGQDVDGVEGMAVCKGYILDANEAARKHNCQHRDWEQGMYLHLRFFQPCTYACTCSCPCR